MSVGEHDEVRGLKDDLRARSGKGPSRLGSSRGDPVTSVRKVESDRARKNSRTKGNRAELDVAEAFSRWSGEVVRRTPQSGGWSSARFGVTADLVCPNEAFPFHVEVKHREGWVLDDLVTGVRRDHDKSVAMWWKQCVDSCPRGGKLIGGMLKKPLLVFRRNHQPWLVMARVGDSVADTRGRVGGERVLSFSMPPSCDVRRDSREVFVMMLAAFLDYEEVPEGLANHGGGRGR